MARYLPHAEVRLGRQGRLVIPAAMRRSLSVTSGDLLVARVENGSRLVLEKREESAARLQARFADIPRTVKLAKALLAERRAEARRERNR